ncbi:MAG: hypothetical protein HYS55_05555 [Candidatus Omnitrophica bacterium]|nr:hypothetical protein [Candidatus Omnitrophota bacterium]
MVRRILFSLFFVLFLSVPCAFCVVEGPSDLSARMAKLEEKVGGLERTVSSQQTVITEQASVITEQASQIQVLKSVITEKKPTEAVYLPTKAEMDKKVDVGYGKLTVGGLFQGWYSHGSKFDDTARIRRTELKFAGEIVNKLNWTIMIDPVQVREDNTRRSVLQDAYLTLGYIPKHKLDIGQFKIPVTEEGLRSSAKLDTLERAFITRTFGDHRDVGVMLTGDWDFAMYQFGVFNGQEQNNLDINDKKDFAWRIVGRPFRLKEIENEIFKNLELGYSQYYNHSADSISTAQPEKSRYGFEARWEYDRYSLKSEVAWGQTAAAPVWGWYGQAGYYVIPKLLQGVIKYDVYEPNERASFDKARELTFGLNYFLDSYHAKFQLNYVFKEGQDSLGDNQVLGGVQVAL